jgi:predicted outer membrane protein
VNPSVQADVRADASFVQQAASANMMEVQLGQTAQSRASNQAVKQFGLRMVNDHTNLENQLATLATSNGLVLQQKLNSKHQDQVNKLNKLSGQAFDSAYMNQMVMDHQEDIANFTTQSRSAKSAAVRSLATNALPVLQQHLSLATQVRSQMGIDTTTTPVAGGGNGNQHNGNKNVQSDADFIQNVNAGNTMFVQLADIAQNKAKHDNVKQFAKQARTDFQQMQNRWANMSSNNDMKAGGMGQLHHDKIEKVQKASGKNFDQTYMTVMIQQLHDRVTYWEKEGRQANSAQVRNLVNEGLPTLKQLYSDAERVSRDVGVNPQAALKNRTDVASGQQKKGQVTAACQELKRDVSTTSLFSVSSVCPFSRSPSAWFLVLPSDHPAWRSVPPASIVRASISRYSLPDESERWLRQPAR